jgi:peptidoglycan/LPS O-acetylase OafA/YrhL
VTAYRPDIDGLRAIAVVAVVLFHAHFGPFTGGFVGVDVFFVISGYLIVGMIVGDLRSGHFSIAAFYERRLRRLFPALFVVMAACAIAGYLLFLPEEFRKFGQSLVATSAFVSNYLFWSEAGYFDSPPELKPLLHTWSLAVEEQFYLIFPALLMIVTRYVKRSLTGVLIVIAGLSFATATASLVKHPDSAFYLPHTRVWEFLIGALLVVVHIPVAQTRSARELLACTGLALIVVSTVAYSSMTLFPGPAAALPCLGAAMVIHAGRGGGSSVHSMLTARPIVHVGLISYSLYLWHWPILVFARAWLVRPLTILEATGLIAISFLLAHLSWRFVESPFRIKRQRYSRNQVFAFGASATALMLAAGVAIDVRGGLPSRVPPDVAVAAAGAFDADLSFRRRCSNFSPEQVSEDILCKIGSNAAAGPTFILWGDSHAFAMASMISDVARDDGRAGLVAGSGGCAPLLGVSRTTSRSFPCEAFNDRVVDLIRRDAAIATVILVSRWSLTADGRRYLHEGGADTFVRDSQSQETGLAENGAVFRRGLERTLAALRDAGKRVVVVGPVPEVGFDVPTTLARTLWFERSFPIDPERGAFLARQQVVLDTLQDLQRRSDFVLIQPHQLLCDAARCRTGTGDHSLYVDDNHLSITGATLLRPLFEPVFAMKAASIEHVEVRFNVIGPRMERASCEC